MERKRDIYMYLLIHLYHICIVCSVKYPFYPETFKDVLKIKNYILKCTLLKTAKKAPKLPMMFLAMMLKIIIIVTKPLETSVS